MAIPKFKVVSSSYWEAEAVASGAKTAGTPIAISARVVGFPITDVANGATYAAVYAAEKVRAVKAVPSEVIFAGSLLYWDASAVGVTAIAGGLTCTLGFSVKASTATDTDVAMNFYGLNQVLA